MKKWVSKARDIVILALLFACGMGAGHFIVAAITIR